jgi:hypothetical protein
VADVVPKGESANLSVRASGFIPPLGPAYVFETLELKGTLSRAGLREVQAEGTLFGGKLKAEGAARFGPNIVVDGKFSIESLNLEPLVALFAREVSVSGGADLKGTFSLQADSIEKLFEQPRAEFGLSASRGTINNVDLVRAAQSPTRDGVRGGRTRYNTMSAVVTVTANRASVQQLRIVSDAMSAAGGFEVQGKGELSGRLGIQVGPRGTVVAQGNVAVTGDARNPVLR